MSKLLPCPFCGGEANIIKQECLSNGFISYQVYHSNPICPINGFLKKSVYVTEREAIESWNIRKPMEKIREELEGLKEETTINYNMSFYKDCPEIKGKYKMVTYYLNKAIEIVEKGGME